MAITEALLTAEEFRLLPDNGQPSELVAWENRSNEYALSPPRGDLREHCPHTQALLG
jgi:hypothetical protein